MDNMWEGEGRNLGRALSYRASKDITGVCSPWEALKIGGKMMGLLLGNVTDNNAKKVMVAMEGLSCCLLHGKSI